MMKRLIVLVSVLVSASALSCAEPPAPNRLNSIRRGMPAEEVKKVCGPPSRVARQVLFRRYLEQWQYDEFSGYVEIVYPRGEAGYVSGVHSGSP